MTILIRADASVGEGTGHVMRCLALAQAWQDSGGKCTFVHALTTPAIAHRLRAEGMPTTMIAAAPGSTADAEITARHARDTEASWVIADGYHFAEDWQQVVKREVNLRLMMIDDHGHAGLYLGDLVLDQNPTATSALYQRCSAQTRLLLGSKYVLLRREFVRGKRAQEERLKTPGERARVLITMGGSDPTNSTDLLIRAVASLAAVTARVIVGGSNPRRDALQQAATAAGGRIELLFDAPNMAEQMEWPDVAITAAGSTSWELAFMGVPALYVIVAANQEPIARRLADEKIGLNLGWHHDLTVARVAATLQELIADPAERAGMQRRAREYVDGRGADRVVFELKKALLQFRAVEARDARTIWLLANDPVARLNSFSSASIPWDGHERWFAAQLADADCRFLLVAAPDGKLVGQIRFDLQGDEAIVSITIAADQRGRGWGAALIDRACDELLTQTKVRIVRAYIKPDNIASVRAFEKSGFASNGEVVYRNSLALELVRMASPARRQNE